MTYIKTAISIMIWDDLQKTFYTTNPCFFNPLRIFCRLNGQSYSCSQSFVHALLWPSKFNFREMRKVSARKKYRHVNEDMSLAFELFWLSTREKNTIYCLFIFLYSMSWQNIHVARADKRFLETFFHPSCFYPAFNYFQVNWVIVRQGNTATKAIA